jgi:flagellar basal-body rod modification protein FlgD
VNLIGKQATLRGQNFAFDGSGAAVANVKLGADAGNVTVSVKDSSGTVIRTMNLGAEKAGPLALKWDGKSDTGQIMPAGSYSFSVSATTKGGATVPVSQDVTGVVTAVSFDKGYPQVTLDSGVTGPISDLVSTSAAPVKP